jgi:hypothetical protein
VNAWMLLCAAIIVCGTALAAGLVRPGQAPAATSQP